MGAEQPKPSLSGAAPVAPSEVDGAAGEEEIPSTRAERAWMRVVPALVVLVIGIVFVAQNTQHAKVSFLTGSGTVPLAVGLLGAFALGGATVAFLGTMRIHELRKIIRGRRRTQEK